MKLKRFVASGRSERFFFAENDLCIRKGKSGDRIASIDIDSGSVLSGRLSGLGFFIESESSEGSVVRMRSITVSREDIFPRDMGLIKTEI
jgi:hypothetical protein